MFVGLIAAIVVIIVIALIMATGGTSASGGIDQSKAAKVMTELSTLVQGIGFYKTTTDANDYAGISVQALIDSGIVASGDTEVLATGHNFVYDDGTAVADGTKVIKSRANPDIAYVVQATDMDQDGNIDNTNTFEVRVIARSTMPSTLKSALDINYERKLKDKIAAYINTNIGANADGSVDLSFR